MMASEPPDTPDAPLTQQLVLAWVKLTLTPDLRRGEAWNIGALAWVPAHGQEPELALLGGALQPLRWVEVPERGVRRACREIPRPLTYPPADQARDLVRRVHDRVAFGGLPEDAVLTWTALERWLPRLDMGTYSSLGFAPGGARFTTLPTPLDRDSVLLALQALALDLVTRLV